MEQPFEPPDELGLGDPEFRLGRRPVAVERQREHVQFFLQVGRQRHREFGDRTFVDLGQPFAGSLVERRLVHLVEELLDHRPDPHHLGRFGDRLPGDLFRLAIRRHVVHPVVPFLAGCRDRVGTQCVR